MSQRLDAAVEKADRQRQLQADARARVRRVETEVHSAIGLVLDGAAALKTVGPVEVLGVADYLAEMLDKPEVLANVRARGLALYSQKFVRAVALTVLGDTSERALSEKLRQAGFVRAGRFWSGDAIIPEAIRLAKENGLSLLRYDADDVPVFYIRKGIAQPEVATLEAEHAQMLKVAQAALQPVESGDYAARTAVSDTVEDVVSADAVSELVDLANWDLSEQPRRETPGSATRPRNGSFGRIVVGRHAAQSERRNRRSEPGRSKRAGHHKARPFF